MANKIYGSTGGLSNEIVKIYGSVGGLSDNVVKGYCSVDGLSKLFFGSGEDPYEDLFWFYYETLANTTLFTAKYSTSGTQVLVSKGNNRGITFFSVFFCGGLGYNVYYPLLVSTDSNAISLKNISNKYSGEITINYDTWYYAIPDIVFPLAYASDLNVFTPNCELKGDGGIAGWAVYNQEEREKVVRALLTRIYANDFAENYQVGHTYNLVKGNIEKTIRKFLAVYLYKMIPYKNSYTTAYNLILSNIENIVAYFIQHLGNNDIIDLWADYNDSGGFRLGVYYSNESTDNINIENIDSDEGGYTAIETDAYIHYSSCVYIDFNGDGTVTYNTPSWTTDDFLYIGKGGYGWDYLHWCNVGLNFLPRPVHTYNIVPEYDYVVNNTYQVHNLLSPQVALDALWQYFERIYTSSLTSVAYLKEHWSEIRNVILSYISSFNTMFGGIGIIKRDNKVSIIFSLGQNTFPKSSIINFHGSPRYGVLWRINPTGSEAIQTTHNLNITITGDSYTTTFQPWTANMTDIGLYGAIFDNINSTDRIEISNYGMKEG